TGKLNLSKVSSFVLSVDFIPMLGLTLLGMLFASERWRILLASQEIHTTWWKAFQLSMIGNFFNFAMPGGVGGDFIKAYYCSRDHSHHKMGSVTSVLMDRVLGLFVMSVMALIVMVLDLRHVLSRPTLSKLFVFLCALVLGFCIAFYLIFSKKLRESGVIDRTLNRLPLASKLVHAYHTLHFFANSRRILAFAGLVSLVSQCVAVLVLYFVGVEFAHGMNLSLATFFIVAPLGFMATAIPISPAGVGIGQAAFFFLFNEYLGYESDLGSVVITTYQIAQFILSLSGAIFNLARKNHGTDLPA
ncbi:MAG TPA: lysylphosphatidylglycerol synthase transmembrane domain-containing protein, partial [Pseudobdellovibrionaceae bacterium]|nr:lysylphosphatidylglycerol synthase transmembrane domain-containing protein [Pseudobdellovibrionaceae bacterium]